MIDFLDGYAGQRMEELDERKLKRPIVKTQLMEVLNGREPISPERVVGIFLQQGLRLIPIEEELYLAVNADGLEIGFLEIIRPRLVALYSVLKSDLFSKHVRHLVYSTPEIDFVWLSGLTFNALWEIVSQITRRSRFGKLVFTHESVFDIESDSLASEEDEEEEAEEERPDDEEIPELEEVIERRAARFTLVDRIDVIGDKLAKLQSNYSPLYAISQLRFPSPVSRGGHDFYDNGYVSNRSDSFRDHRAHVLFVLKIYENLLRSTEEQSWYAIEESVGVPGGFSKIVGAPVVVCFRDSLNENTFNRWISATFERKNNKFRLWGNPIRLGPTKVHVYGVDRHLWQPLFLEMTSKGIIAIVPNGTCGNTVHRLVTNIQRYVDPGAEAYIGNKPYKEMVKESIHGIPRDF
jgi:hypothetical protein